jgi:hypothetical protein
MIQRLRDLPPSFQVYTVIEVLAYLAAAGWAIPQTNLLVVAFLILIFASTGMIKPVPSPFGGIIDPNIGLIIIATLLWPAEDVLIGVGVGSFIGLVLFRKNELWRAATNGAGWGLPAATAALVAHTVAPGMSPGLPQLAIAGALAVVTYRIINTGIFAIFRSLRFGRPVLTGWLQNIVDSWSSQLLSAPLAVTLAAIAERTHGLEPKFALTAAYMIALPIARQEYGYYIRAQQTLTEIVEAMVRALEGVDPAARAHGERVSKLATEAGRSLRMSEREILALRLASRLHDVGLLAGPEGSAAEEHHAAVGSRVLGRFPDPLIAEYVRAHHERWDGKGVPDGKRGTAIPVGARILAAVEIYDSAIAGLPPFGSPLSSQAAASHLISLAGTILDPKVVMTILRVAAAQQTEVGAAG